jgi:ribosome-associated toxin RatA of RatAB toxin-antitoxin module
MAVIQRNAHVPYSADQMLTLVNDIDTYPEFLHWCHAARIEQTSGSTVDAALEIGISGIYKTIRTRNTTSVADESGVPATIRLEMVEGPLKSLNGAWRFADAPGGGCDVELHLEYEVHLSPLGLILRSLFDEIANSQLNAFVRRARVVYGDS